MHALLEQESFACFNDAVFNTTRQAYEILRYWGGKLLALPRPPPDERSGEIHSEQLQKARATLFGLVGHQERTL